MSTPYITFDPSAPLNLYFRIARSGSKKLVFKNTDETPYDISGGTWLLRIKNSAQSSTNVLQLSSGSGLTIGGDDNNEMTISVTETTSNLPEKIYYWELFNDTTNVTWLCGDCYFYSGVTNNNDSTTEITVDLGETTVEITVQDAITSIDGGTP